MKFDMKRLTKIDKRYLMVFIVCIAATNVATFTLASAYYERFAFAPIERVGIITVQIKRAGETEWTTICIVKNLLTNGGKDFIKTQLGTSANASKVIYISLSTSSSSPDATWTNIPTEITNNGLERAEGTYTSLGTGNWKIEKTFTATGTHTGVKLTGLSWDADGNGGGLLACATITTTDLSANDQLKITWTQTVS